MIAQDVLSVFFNSTFKFHHHLPGLGMQQADTGKSEQSYHFQ